MRFLLFIFKNNKVANICLSIRPWDLWLRTWLLVFQLGKDGNYFTCCKKHSAYITLSFGSDSSFSLSENLNVDEWLNQFQCLGIESIRNFFFSLPLFWLPWAHTQKISCLYRVQFSYNWIGHRLVVILLILFLVLISTWILLDYNYLWQL